ncbi:peptide-methionine (R)-S-oxide reductase [Aquimarina sp. EL_43]|uniref:peptide-methionine (R)-S-oxide reductase MsrB n=1 Tax=Aquimarina TaxID=290174 RepID=UPI0004713BFF|nr:MULTISPECIES: peptide-methionine (R)-S-oxide reductase MsrB [Aquimarina]MBG6129678.1 peptide-methionine (R)-S-oxide reductase [Aquimarina sp. EL_35]MBG6150743.1 peptide-methionine (R)-S-oxide reductase [Aquimarina sp. EL_32]MBG6167950.1 peptide-methionine (R)-S-oxide reductase [Aquimarina sp. EL_43]
MKRFIVLCISILAISCTSTAQKEDKKESKVYAVSKTDAEWKKILTSEQYYILRQAGTERPFSSPLNKLYAHGTFYCAACNTPLYESKYKFDSGTGWPSFDRAIEGSIDKDIDHKLGYARSELLCATCGGHLGHVFSDGPKETTGMRHCINGDALVFKSNE